MRTKTIVTAFSNIAFVILYLIVAGHFCTQTEGNGYRCCFPAGLPVPFIWPKVGWFVIALGACPEHLT